MENEYDEKWKDAMCVVCGKNEGPLKNCSRCKKIKYCGPACQRSDWPRHKQDCCSVDDQKFLKDWENASRSLHKQVTKAIKTDLEEPPIMCTSETAFGFVMPFAPLPPGVPPNFKLKQQATLHYHRGPSSNGGLGNMMGERHFRAYYDDLVDESQLEAWDFFFDHPGNFDHVVHTVGILGTLATIYRQRGNNDDCEKVLNLGAKFLDIYERNARAMNDQMEIMNWQDFRFRHQHVRYNLYFQQKRYDENVQLYRELMKYEVGQPTPWEKTRYLKMVPYLLHKKPTVQVLESLTDEEVREMVLYVLEAGLPKCFEEAKNKVTLYSCANCAVKEKHMGQHQTCSRCKQVWYCNGSCQRANWKSHKKACKAATKQNLEK